MRVPPPRQRPRRQRRAATAKPEALAQGKSLQQAVEELGHVAEGVYCARTVLQRSRSLDIEMPITECVVDLLDGRIRPEQAVSRLMGREPGSELA